MGCGDPSGSDDLKKSTRLLKMSGGERLQKIVALRLAENVDGS